MCSPYCECGLPQPAPARPSRKKSCATKRIARYLLLQDIKSYQITVQLQTDYRAKELAGDHSNKQVKAICKAICCQIPCLDTIYWAIDQDMKHWAAAIPFRKKIANPKTALIPCRGYSWRPQYRGLDHRSGSVWLWGLDCRSGSGVWIACGFSGGWSRSRIFGLQPDLHTCSTFASHNLSKRKQSHQTRKQIQVYTLSEARDKQGKPASVAPRQTDWTGPDRSSSTGTGPDIPCHGIQWSLPAWDPLRAFTLTLPNLTMAMPSQVTLSDCEIVQCLSLYSSVLRSLGNTCCKLRRQNCILRRSYRI